MYIELFLLSNNVHEQNIELKQFAKKLLRTFKYWNREKVKKVVVVLENSSYKEGCTYKNME